MQKIILTLILLFATFFFSGLVSESHAQSGPPSFSDQVPKAADLSDDELLQIGMQIWQNQCSVWNAPDTKITHSMKKGLTDWDDDIDAATIGMGQYLWYPSDATNRMQEDWPVVAKALKAKGYPVKKWLLGECPWDTKEEFMAHFNGHKLTYLRKMLAQKPVIVEQTRCDAERLDAALAKILASVDADGNLSDVQKTNLKKVITTHFNELAMMQTPVGLYALMDYVHFRGEGVLQTERIDGDIGWGLRQALTLMNDNVIGQQGPVAAFVAAADKLYFDDDGYDYKKRYDSYLTFHFQGAAEETN